MSGWPVEITPRLLLVFEQIALTDIETSIDLLVSFEWDRREIAAELESLLDMKFSTERPDL